MPCVHHRKNLFVNSVGHSQAIRLFQKNTPFGSILNLTEPETLIICTPDFILPAASTPRGFHPNNSHQKAPLRVQPRRPGCIESMISATCVWPLLVPIYGPGHFLGHQRVQAPNATGPHQNLGADLQSWFYSPNSATFASLIPGRPKALPRHLGRVVMESTARHRRQRCALDTYGASC
ncbi:hypothetical protein BJX70DRAFT_144554 [Aspergillus crustosus]